MLTKEFDRDCTTIMITQPQFWRFGLSEKPKKFIGFCVWEGDRIPQYWKPFIEDERVDMVFTPSTHTKNAILNAFKPDLSHVLKKINIIYHGVDLNLLKPLNSSHKNFIFLANKGWAKGINDRGGIQWILKAFSEEFTNKDKVELRLKINPSYNQPNWNFNEEVKKLGFESLTKPDKPLMMVNTDIVPFQDLYKFYNQGDVFISLSMADAFGLPSLEAMACGLPCIQTNYGGQTDFVDNENGWLIDYNLVDVKGDMMYEEVKWAKPDIKQAREVMRYCYENQEEVKRKGKKALMKAREFTWINTAKRIKRILR